MGISAKEEIKTWECNFKWGCQQGFMEKVVFEQRPEGSEAVSHVGIQGKRVSGRGHGKLQKALGWEHAWGVQ